MATTNAQPAPTHRPASEASQILRSFRKWIAIQDAIASLDLEDRPDADEVLEPYYLQKDALELRIARLVPQTVEEMAAQVMATTNFGTDWLTNTIEGLMVRNRMSALLDVEHETELYADD